MPSAALTAPTTSIGAKAKGAARPAPPQAHARQDRSAQGDQGDGENGTGQGNGCRDSGRQGDNSRTEGPDPGGAKGSPQGRPHAGSQGPAGTGYEHGRFRAAARGRQGRSQVAAQAGCQWLVPVRCTSQAKRATQRWRDRTRECHHRRPG